ncbi:ABC transporter ATP-binding protein [Rubrimonas cliftonensis]|uniref:Spermidine/putrescine import ATP-binding protein PotA n=1 Tax=Rubrimonas cliftonensis TaxID=89524 RepID=A0A1H4F660_9RHOB|nr:ABC transporter ATP-binding protein [Rubrimonas cliftonensis]SEA92400.1 spermidine/putrescine transport system ATP-binding protein [Rubrimonas cliftonensis]
MTASIEIRRVSKRFGDFTALDDVSLALPGGGFFTLLGPSGCGKTTLLRLIAGFEYPTEGAILLDGADIAAMPPNRRPVNTVFQSYALFPHMTVADNIAFGLEMLDRPRTEVRATVAEMLALVKMEALARRRPAQLSGGQQQRVALARALAPKPKVLLLDEPLSALDLKLRKEMQSELKRLQRETGVTFVFVTHDQEEALTMSDAVAVMSAGRVLQVGAPRDIYAHPADRFVAGFIGETNFLEGRVAGMDGPLVRVALDGGGTVTAAARAEPPATGARTTLAVRPEHVALTDADAPGALTGAVSEIVYVGPETHAHLTLDAGPTLLVRLPNRGDGAAEPRPGDRLGALIRPGIAQMLKD